MKTSTSKKTSQGGAKRQTTGSSKKSSDTASGLQELFIKELKDIYWAEKALVKAIPKMIKNATNEELITALEEHLSVTEEQVRRVEEIFTAIDVKAEAKKCEAMAGLIKEAEEIMSEAEKGVVRDAAIIAAAQKVEHYEIAVYGTARAFALQLGHNDAVNRLQEILNQETETDALLTKMATGEGGDVAINQEAASNGSQKSKRP